MKVSCKIASRANWSWTSSSITTKFALLFCCISILIFTTTVTRADGNFNERLSPNQSDHDLDHEEGSNSETITEQPFEEKLLNLTFFNADASKGGFIVGHGICQCGRSPGKPSPIFGTLSKNDIPWTATLLRRDLRGSGEFSIFCGGTLINDLYILTASHCIEGLNSDDIVVSLNDDDNLPSESTIESTQKYIVSKIIMHRQYNSKTLTHDIALLKLSEPIDFLATLLLPACLPIANDQYHGKYVGTITRWVDIALYGRGNSILQKIIIPLISVDQCKRKSHYEQKISENMICAGFFNSTKSCQGDSGGPLTITRGDRQLLVGIASWGLGCVKPFSPNIYTRVAKYITWILDNTTDGEFCIE